MSTARDVPEILPASPDVLAAAAEAGIAFDDGDLEKLHGYLVQLYETNARMNLTAVKDPVEAWTKHVLDSLTLLPWLNAAMESGEKLRVLDVGSGGGCPGIPLACVLPDVRFTLLESTGKKARFLESTVEVLGLKNVDVVADRAENAAHDPAHRAGYQLVLSRAVGRLPVLLELTVPFAVEGGLVLSIKGAQAQAEIAEARQALHMLHSTVVDVVENPTGRVVVVEKCRKTPKAYPRSPGEPGRKPLGTS